MFLEPVVTNGATVLVQITLWSWLAWTVTYWYMSRKVVDLREKLDTCDWYIYETNLELDLMISERAGLHEHLAHLQKIIDETERVYGDVLDDYTEYYLTDKGLESL